MVDWISFARWSTEDRCVRSKEKEKDGVIKLVGNYCTRQFSRPVPGKGETLVEFNRRDKQCRRQVPRGSDQSLRIAFAVQALVRSGMSVSKAAVSVVDLISSAPARSKAGFSAYEERCKLKRLPVVYNIGNTRRNRRFGPTKSSTESKIIGEQEVIRSIYYRERKREGFRELFELEVAVFSSKDATVVLPVSSS